MHDMETIPALQVVCVGNPPITDGFPSQNASNTEFDAISQQFLYVLLPVATSYTVWTSSNWGDTLLLV